MTEGVAPGLLRGRVSLITGGARGLGRAISLSFAAEGAVGAILDRPDVCQEGSPPTGFDFVAADVTEETELAAAVAALVERRSRIDITVANAGVVPAWRETENLEVDEWDSAFAVNVRGVAATIKHVVPAMKARGGSIIVMCSINSLRGHPRQMLYTATKHAAWGSCGRQRSTSAAAAFGSTASPLVPLPPKR
jgi:NAD(P)-dependent dehydrogenase (short-subunit alcohol dehydrogenase family)